MSCCQFRNCDRDDADLVRYGLENADTGEESDMTEVMLCSEHASWLVHRVLTLNRQPFDEVCA